MNIKQKLLGNTVLMAAGIIGVAAVGLFAVTSIQSSLNELTSYSTPLQSKTLEVQERTERVMGALLKLGIATDGAEIESLSTQAEEGIKDIERINAEMKQLGASVSNDMSAFATTRAVVLQAAEKKQANTAGYNTEAKAINAALKRSEDAIAEVRQGAAKLESEADAAAALAQQASLKLNEAIKTLLAVQARMKEVTIIIAEVDMVKSRFKISPLKERMKAQTDGISAALASAGDAPLFREIQAVNAALADSFGRDATGLAALRAEALGGKDAEAAYQKTRKAMASSIDELYAKIAGAVDGNEMQIVKQREQLNAAVGFRVQAGGLMAASSLISVDIKDVAARTRLVMMAASETELAAAQKDLGELQKQLGAGTAKLREALAKMGKPALQRSAETAAATINALGESIARVTASRRGVLDAEEQVRVAIRGLKAVAAEKSALGDKQVKSIGEAQQNTVAAVNERVGQAFLIILAMSGAAVVISLLVSVRIMLSITRPVARAAEVAQAVASGDLSAEFGTHWPRTRSASSFSPCSTWSGPSGASTPRSSIWRMRTTPATRTTGSQRRSFPVPMARWRRS